MAQGKIETIISAKDTSQGVFKNLSGNLIAMNQGLELANKALSALTAPFNSIVSEGRKFGAQMSAVQAISKTTASEFQQLTDEAKRIGETTAFTAVQAGEAMEELRRAGLGVTDTLTTTSQAMDLAAATGADLGTAARVVAVNMKIFENESLSAKKAVDLMVQTVGASPQSFENLTGAIETSGGTAAAVGIPFEDLTGIFGAMAEAGVRGEKAGTALNGAISRLLNPSSEAVKILKKYNLTVDQLNPANQEFASILDTLNGAQITQADLLKVLGQEVAPKFFKVISKGGESIRDFTKAQKEANTASEAAAQRLNNLEGDVTIFDSAVSGLKLTIFESLDSILRKIVQGSTAMIGAFSNFVRQHQDSVTGIFQSIVDVGDTLKDGFVFLIRTFGSFLVAISKILRIQVVIDLFNAFQTIISLAVDQLKIIVKFLIELNKRIIENIKSSEGLHAIFKQLIPVITAIVKFTGKLVSLFSTLSKIVFNLILKSLDPLFQSFENVFKSISKVYKVLSGPVLKALSLFGVGVDTVNDLAKALDETLTGNTLSVSLETVADELEKTGKTLENFGKDTKKANVEAKKLDATLKKIDEATIKIESDLKGGGFLDDISSFFDGLVTSVKEISKNVSTAVAGPLDGLGGAVGGALSGVLSNLIDSIVNLFTSNEKFAAALDDIFSAIGEIFGPIVEAFIPILEQVADAIRKLAPFFAAIAEDLAPAIEKLAELAVQIIEALAPIIEEILSKMIPIFEEIVDQLGPILVEVIEALGPLISVLLDIIGPILREIIPLMKEILVLVREIIPLLTELFKLFKIFLPFIINLIRIIVDLVKVIVKVLTPIIHFLIGTVNELTMGLKTLENGVRAIMNGVISFFGGLFSALGDVFRNLISLFGGVIDSIKSLIKSLSGGGIGGTLGDIIGGVKGVFGFQGGSSGLTKDQLLRLPGMEAGSGLVKAHVGEQVIPNGSNNTGGMNVTFNVTALDPRSQVEEIRQVLEELSLTGRLRLAQ